MLFGLLGTLLPSLWHSILLERLFKERYDASSEHFELVVAPALVSTALTAVLSSTALVLTKQFKSPFNNNNARPPLLSLAALGLLDALSLLFIFQAFTTGTFPNVLVAAAALFAVSQCLERFIRERSMWTVITPGHSLVCLGVGTYAFCRWTPPFGAYGVSPEFSLTTISWTFVHVAASSVASWTRRSMAQSQDHQQQQSSTDQCHILAWSSALSTLVCLAVAVLIYLFNTSEAQYALLQDSTVQTDLACLGLAYAFAELFYTHVPAEAKYGAKQMLRLSSLAGNATVIGYVRIIGAIGWLGVTWVGAGVAVDCLCGEAGETNHSGFLQLPMSALNSPAEKYTPRFNSSTPPQQRDDDEEEAELYAGHGQQHFNQRASSSPISFVTASLLGLIVPLLLTGCLNFSNTFLQPIDMHSNFASSADVDDTAIEGTGWAVTAHNALRPTCPTLVTAKRYERTHLHTGLATWPRSGNSWTRMLIERASGYRTSTLYCDETVSDVFLDDCYHEGQFLEKSHYPYLGGDGGWERYEKVVRPIRNPIDASYSFWHFWESIRTSGKNHTMRVELDHPLGSKPEEREEILSYARSWVQHDRYWSDAPIPSFVVRYEDLRRATLPNLMALLAFFIPDQDLPSLDQVTCALELNESLQPYQSAKREFFYSWAMLDRETREQILEITKVPFCKHGFDKLFIETVDEPLPIDCAVVRAESGPPPEDPVS